MPYAEDRHIREAFEERNFLKLKNLLERASPDSLEAEFYRGILAENSFDEDGDLIKGLENAKIHYKKAFFNGKAILKAGNYLARIYQKEGKLEEAQKIYNKVISNFQLDKTKFIINQDDGELYYEDILISPAQINQGVYLRIRNSLTGVHEFAKESQLFLTDQEKEELVEVCQDRMAIAYASYRLARIEAEEVINKSLYQTEESERITKDNLVKTKDLYKRALDIYKDIAPNSRACMKALYHQGKLELRVFEQERESINRSRYVVGDNPGKSEIGLTVKDKSIICKINGEEIKIESSSNRFRVILDRIKASSRSISLSSHEIDELNKAICLQKLQNIKDIFRESKDKGYNIAEAEILNIDARFLSLDKAIAKYDEALKIDPKNINAKLKKAKAIEISSGEVLDNAKYDQSLKLVREVLKNSPQNSDAKHYVDEMQRKISRLITSQIERSLIEKVRTVGPQPQFFDDEYLMRMDREGIVSELSMQIAAKLNESDFIKSEMLFSEVSGVTKEITDKLWIDNEELFQKAVLNKSDRSIDKLATAALQSISEWEIEKKDKPRQDVDISEIVNRIAFKKQTTQKLNKLYRAFMAATEDNPLVQLNVKDGSFVGVLDVVNNMCPYAAALCGPLAGGPIFAAVGSVAKWGAGEVKNYQQEAACKAAKAFCEIGNQDEDRAKKIFEDVAQSLIDTYGMQIDKLDEKGIEKLSNAAVERMLCHVNNRVSYGVISDLGKTTKEIKKFISHPGEYSRRIGEYLSGDKTKIKEDAELLIEGIIEGEAASVAITTKKSEGGKKWEVNEVFTKPAVTRNGKIFYHKYSDLEKYGIRKEKFIPTEYKQYGQEEISSRMIQKLEKDFKSHTKRLSVQDQYEHQQKMEDGSHIKNRALSTTKNEEVRYLAHLKKEESLCKDNKKTGYIGIFMGVASTCVSAILTIASVSAVTPFAIALGVGSAFFPPLAVASLALGGWLFIKGVQTIHKANKQIDNIIDQRIEAKQNAGLEKEGSPQKKQKELQDRLVEKLDKNAKHSYAEREGEKKYEKGSSLQAR